MEKITISNSQLSVLRAEIQGLTNELSEQTAFLPKYHISNLVSALTPFLENLEKSRVELVKKYGTEDEKGNVGIKEVTDETKDSEKPEFTEQYKTFVKDFGEILKVEIEISYNKIPISVFENVQTKGFYDVFYKFLTP